MRALHVPGVIFLFAAFVLSLLTSVSLPYLRTLDITRTHFGDRQVSVAGNRTDQLRFGVWAYCDYDLNGDRHCSDIGYAYTVQLDDSASKSSITIGSSWTRGLAVHPVATIVTVVALLMSLFSSSITLLMASLLSLLSMLLLFIAFLIDIALFAFVRHKFGFKDVNGLRTITGPGFWLNFTAMCLTGLATCSLFIGRRKKRAEETPAITTEKKPFWSRFRKN
ncbi:hypothetical protein AMATHDRAFT_61166 [Amanita thiersii Skay4041]|uniref:Pali-domain-containing protein n=1 Tax=Amanita thiersii Skay4041 TaxID=703135 RepID=A0A2A9NH94_9AGAR|nr:hypothetical protein AMATHDRAFT_61166 [Amanita thiersii Skay4041]